MKAFLYPFSMSPNRAIATTVTYSQIVRGQVIDALMTNQGERVMRPLYGCDIQAALFDPQDELVRHDAAIIIKERLSALVPRAFIISVEVRTGGANATVEIRINYRSAPYELPQEIVVPVSSEYINRALGRGDAA